MRTSRTTPPFSSPETTGDAIRLTCPRSWDELTGKQLRYVLHLLSADADLTEDDVKTFCFVRFAGLSIIESTPDGATFAVGKGRSRRFFTLTNDEIASFISQLNFIFRPELYTCRLDVCAERQALNTDLDGVNFRAYLVLENYYQAYLANPADRDALIAMGGILYPAGPVSGSTADASFSPAELTNIFLWYTHFKHQLTQEFPRLFAPASGGQSAPDMTTQMNSQIRALTGGDVTKEEQVFQTDLRRALTELEAKVRDADELRRQTKK